MDDKTQETEEEVTLADNPFEKGFKEGRAAAMKNHKEGLLNAISNFYDAEAKKRPGLQKVRAKRAPK